MRRKQGNIEGRSRIRWIAEYLIEKRVSFEINVHALYSDVLDEIANENLNPLVMSTFMGNIGVSVHIKLFSQELKRKKKKKPLRNT